MCGIAGWIGGGPDPKALEAMTDALRHRGPDGEGHINLMLSGRGVAAFGHRRLSIIDLEGGHQPMVSHDARFTIVFNGEIYNYLELRAELVAGGAHLSTQSDTEVILEAWRAWGQECLKRFRGMFAFAIHDSESRMVHLVRDNFGKKPLYLAECKTADGPVLVFASEIDALLKHPSVEARLNLNSLFEYLCWRYVPGPQTFFEGVRKLTPGTCLTWRDGQIIEERFWIPPEENLEDRQVPNDPVLTFREIFDEALRLRLRADVPLGVFLSGGLDSASIVASLMKLGAPEIRTYSIGFAGDPASELPAAAETARALGAIHTPIELNVDALFDLLPRLSRHRGSPIAETADLPIYCMSREASHQVKVVLSGEGADEMFAGYPKHLAEHYFGGCKYPRLLGLASRGLLAATYLAPAGARRLRIATRAMSYESYEDRMVAWFGAISPDERDQIWTGPEIVREQISLPFHLPVTASPLRRVLHFDQTSWLPDNLLERLDRMTMAASIEARNPFMDIRLANFATALPDSWRINGLTTKRIVREALASRLPEAVLKRRKNGFRMPVTKWFQGPLRAPFEDLVLGADAISADFLDRSKVRSFLTSHVEGRENHEKTLWALFALETFLREYF